MRSLIPLASTITLALALSFADLAPPAGPSTVAAEGQPSTVVLVHGWHGAGDDTLDGSSLTALAARLRADGHPVRWATGIGTDRSATLIENAEALAASVAAAARDNPDRPVALVGHSQGGIIARAYLETELYARARAQGIRVSDLVALGSPMGGVDLWLPLLFVLGDPSDEPAVWELTPAYMAAFNRIHRPPADVRYTLVVGDARAQTRLLWLLPASDGVVTVASAHALDTPALREVRTRDLHSYTGLTQALGWHSYLDHGPTYERVVARALSGQLPAAAGADTQPVRTFTHGPVVRRTLPPNGSIALDPAHDPDVDPTTTHAPGRLMATRGAVRLTSAGGDIPAPIDEASSVGRGGLAGSDIPGRTPPRATLNLSGLMGLGSLGVSGMLDPRTPSGLTVHAGAAGGSVALLPLAAADSPRLSLATVADGATGQLAVQLRLDRPRDEPSVSGPQDEAQRAAHDRAPRSGSGDLDQPAAYVALTGSDASAELLSEDDHRYRLALRDDGRAGDAVAGDGTVSSGRRVPPGRYLVRARVRIDGAVLETERAVFVPSATPPAALESAGQDAQGLLARVNVRRAGTYVIDWPGDHPPGWYTLPAGRTVLRTSVSGAPPASLAGRNPANPPPSADDAVESTLRATDASRAGTASVPTQRSELGSPEVRLYDARNGLVELDRHPVGAQREAQAVR